MKRSAISVAMLAVFGIASVHAQTYTFTDLGHADGVSAAAAGINSAGQVVGLYMDSSHLNHAVTWINGQAIELGSASTNWGFGGFSNPWGMSGSAISINNAGQIVWSPVDINNASHATAWNNGVTTDLGTLGGAQSEALGINQAGQIVGRAQDVNGNWQAVAWNNGQPTELAAPVGTSSWQANAVNNAGQIVGTGIRQSDNTRQPVMWDQGVATNLDTSWTQSYQIQAYGLNNVGQVVGSVKAPNNVDYYRAVEWDHGVATLLGMPSGYYAAEAKGVNDAGQVVGFMLSHDANVSFRAATWINGQVVDLNSLLSASVLDEGWVLLGANAINDNGQIVGQAYNSKMGVINAFVLTPVPESSTLAMMFLGLGAVTMGARWRSVGKGHAQARG